jgi:hypothetical protein
MQGNDINNVEAGKNALKTQCSSSLNMYLLVISEFSILKTVLVIETQVKMNKTHQRMKVKTQNRNKVIKKTKQTKIKTKRKGRILQQMKMFNSLWGKCIQLNWQRKDSQ